MWYAKHSTSTDTQHDASRLPMGKNLLAWEADDNEAEEDARNKTGDKADALRAAIRSSIHENSSASDAEDRPLPKEETTPPVTKTRDVMPEPV